MLQKKMSLISAKLPRNKQKINLHQIISIFLLILTIEYYANSKFIKA